MRGAEFVLPDDDVERSARINSVIGDVMRRRNDGVEPDDSAIERQHADLMPELGRRLGALRGIKAAATRARQRSSSGGAIDGEIAGFEEDLGFLRSALPQYDILERVSYGGQGIVYKAVQRSTRRTVAIKVLLDGPLASQRQRHRFAREVELVSRLEHPNIVTLYESGAVRGRPYFAMEYVEGEPIDDHVLLHSLSVADIVRLFVAVCRAVSHAHQQGIIHRDLNPSNILVDLEGIPRILDFGLAKDVWMADAAHAQSLLTMSGQVVGTLPYLSPEQAGAGDGQVDVRSDIYSLAVVLFQLLTGGFPYPVDEDPAAVRTNIIAQEPVPLRKALPPDRSAGTSKGIIRDLEVILRKSLSKEKAFRYQSAAAFADDLERCLAGDAVEARADSRYYLLRRTFRKYRAAVAIVALFLLVLSASTVAVTMMWFQARTQRDSARDMARMALGTLGDVITDIDESIRPLAGGMEVRNRLLDDVVAPRLEEMKPLVESDVAMEDLQATLHEKQGDIAYAAGRHAEAAQSYGTSLDIRTAMTPAESRVTDHLLEIARAHRKLAQVSDDAVAHFEHAIEIGQQVVNRRPDDADAKYALCESLVEFGRHLYLSGRYEQAAEQIDDAFAAAAPMAQSADDEERWDALLAKAHEWDGDIHVKLGHGQRSIRSLTESLRICRELSEARPADAGRRHQTLITCLKLGSLLIDDGRLDQAKATLNAAVSIGEYLVSIDPTVAVWQRDLFSAHHRLARAYLKENDSGQARSHCDAAVILAENLADREPDNREWQLTLAYAHALRGQVSLKVDEPGKARDDLKTALEIRERVSVADPGNLALLKQLEASHTWVGYCARLQGDTGSAMEHYRRAHEITEALFAVQPDVTQRALNVIGSKTNLAIGHFAFDTPEHSRIAASLLNGAAASLDSLRDSGKLAGRSETYRLYSDEIRDWLERLAERTQQGAQAGRVSTSLQDRQALRAREP